MLLTRDGMHADVTLQARRPSKGIVVAEFRFQMLSAGSATNAALLLGYYYCMTAIKAFNVRYFWEDRLLLPCIGPCPG